MWKDEASNIDLLFFKPISNTIVELCLDSKNTPLTMGVFGEWGAGKSTILNFIESEINKKDKQYCIHLNAWELEGYDDAKIAIIESVVSSIEKNTTFFGDCKKYFKKFWDNLNLLKATGYLVKKGISIVGGGLTGNSLQVCSSVVSMVKDISSKTKEISDELNEEQKNVTTENIRNVKKYFKEIIDASKIENLVIIIDDLDRCLPNRIVEILEATKLFLSVNKTTFIYGVDEKIVRYAIRQQYPINDDNDISKEYIEKIIQYPVIIPKLSPKDMQNYLLLLYIQSKLSIEEFNKVMNNLSEGFQLLKPLPIEINFFKTIISSDEFILIEDEYDEINLIRECVSSNLNGNPRKAKRFLNSFSFKKKMSKTYFPECDSLVLAKLMCLYNLNSDAFQDLSKNSSEFDPVDGFLCKLENENFDGASKSWSAPSVRKWLKVEPLLKEIDLSNYFYLTRDMLDDVIDYVDKYETEVVKKVNECANSKLNYKTVENMIVSFIDKNQNLLEEVISYTFDKHKRDDSCFNIIVALLLHPNNMQDYIEHSIIDIKLVPNISNVIYWARMMEKSDKIKKYIDEIKNNKTLNETVYKLIMQEYKGENK